MEDKDGSQNPTSDRAGNSDEDSSVSNSGQSEQDATEEAKPSSDKGEGGSSSPSGSSTLIIMVGIIVLLALAVISKPWEYYLGSKGEKEQAPVGGESVGAESSQQQGPAGGQPEQKGPPPTPGELYEKHKQMMLMEAIGRRFVVGTKDNQRTFIIAGPPTMRQQKDGHPKIDASHAYNVTKRKEGLVVDHIYKGIFFRDQVNPLSSQPFPALGSPEGNPPKFLEVDDVYHVEDEYRVLGVAVGDEAKAYPIRMLNYHRVVNDTIANTPIVVWWSPMVDMGTVAIRRVGDKEYTFGPSGRIYQSAEVLYDHQTESLWAHFSHEAIAGSATGAKLTPISSLLTTWKYWREKHPKTLMLSNATGMDDPPDYFTDIFRTQPFAYYKDDHVHYPVDNFDPEDTPLPAKEQVLGVYINGEAKAYPFSQLKKAEAPIADTVGGQKVTIHFHTDHFTVEEGGKEVAEDIGTAYAVNAEGKPLEARTLYWFVWESNFPNTKIHGLEVKPKKKGGDTAEAPEPKEEEIKPEAVKEEKK